MPFTDSVRAFFVRYLDFRGRSSRSEYWWAILFVLLAPIGLGVVDNVLFSFPVLAMVFQLAVFIPSICLLIRRLHDTDRTGWWILIMPAIVLGTMYATSLALGTPGRNDHRGILLVAAWAFVSITAYGIMFVWCCLRGTRGPNRFGPDPLGARLA